MDLTAADFCAVLVLFDGRISLPTAIGLAALGLPLGVRLLREFAGSPGPVWMEPLL